MFMTRIIYCWTRTEIWFKIDAYENMNKRHFPTRQTTFFVQKNYRFHFEFDMYAYVLKFVIRRNPNLFIAVINVRHLGHFCAVLGFRRAVKFLTNNKLIDNSSFKNKFEFILSPLRKTIHQRERVLKFCFCWMFSKKVSLTLEK